MKRCAVIICEQNPTTTISPRLLETVSEAGLTPKTLSVEALLHRNWMDVSGDSQPVVAIVTADVTQPLVAGRLVHSMAPTIQLLFLCDPGNEREMRTRIPKAAMIGNHWTLAVSDASYLIRVINECQQATLQRRSHRVVLDQVNQRLSESRDVNVDRVRHLEVSDRFMATILHSAADAILAVEYDGKIRMMNESACRWFGVRENTMIRKPIASLAKGGWSRIQDLIVAAQAGERIKDRECTCKISDDQTMTVEVTILPVIGEDRNNPGLSVMLHDITERKATEAALREATTALARKNKGLEQLMYSLSHDLRSPLMAVSGLTELIEEDAKHGRLESIAEMTPQLSRSVDRMVAMVEDLLDFGRIETGTINLEPACLTQVVEEVVDQISARRDAAIARNVTVSQTMPTIHADLDHLYHALDNLIGNALKYGKNTPNLKVEVGAEIEEDGVTLFVRDNGPGIDPKYHANLFNLFERATEDQPGTGIGLAIVAKAMELHGGTATVESNPGEGATFRLKFPLACLVPEDNSVNDSDSHMNHRRSA